MFKFKKPSRRKPVQKGITRRKILTGGFAAFALLGCTPKPTLFPNLKPPKLSDRVLKEIPIEEIKRLAIESEVNPVYVLDNPNVFGSTTMLPFTFEEKPVQFGVTIYHSEAAKLDRRDSDHISIGYTLQSATSISGFSKLYFQKTGKKLEYARVIVEKKKEEPDPCLRIWLVPVDKPNGEILPDTPVISWMLSIGTKWREPALILREQSMQTLKSF